LAISLKYVKLVIIAPTIERSVFCCVVYSIIKI